MIAAIYDWSGFYIGANGGGGSSRKCWDRNTAVGGVAIAAASEGCHDATGGTVGGQIGYRWQSGAWVFGLEAQGNWADFRGSQSEPRGMSAPPTVRSIDAFGLFTGQVGYAWNNVLLYVKGGAAVTDDKYDGFAHRAPEPSSIDTTADTRWGGAVGVGLEYGFAPNWSVGVEYDHLFMGTHDITASPA